MKVFDFVIWLVLVALTIGWPLSKLSSKKTFVARLLMGLIGCAAVLGLGVLAWLAIEIVPFFCIALIFVVGTIYYASQCYSMWREGVTTSGFWVEGIPIQRKWYLIGACLCPLYAIGCIIIGLEGWAEQPVFPSWLVFSCLILMFIGLVGTIACGFTVLVWLSLREWREAKNRKPKDE